MLRLQYRHTIHPRLVRPGLIGVVFFVALLGLGIASPRSGEAADASRKSIASEPPVLGQAKQLIDKGDYESAASVLRRFLATPSPPEHLDDAYLLLGAALHGMKDYPEALKYLNQLQTEFPASELAVRGKLMLARTHASMGNVDLALPLLAQVRTMALDDDTKGEALKLTADFLVQKKDYVRAIQTLLEGMADTSGEQVKEAREQIREFIAEKLDRRALIRVRVAYPRSYPGDLASIRLIDYYTARGEDHLAEREIQLFLTAFPAHPYGPKANESLSLLKTKLKANQYFIAAVLPLSGHLAPFANDVLEGIQLAVERVREQPGMPSIGLIVKDHDPDRQGFLEDLSTLLDDDRPLVVIGPMLSKNLPVMAEMAQRTRVPLITPAATLPNVRRLGNFLFSTSLTYALQAERIADYAIKEQGYRRFCILHPDTVYGRELARLFAQEVRQRDGEVIAVESFMEGQTDFSPQITRLKAEDLTKYGVAVPVDPSRPADKPISRTEKRLLYTPGFDAMFIPSRSSEIGLIAAQLAFHDVKVPLLGTNGWNSQDFARTADRTVDGATFVDGFFVDSPYPAVQEFVQRYQKRFQTTPSLFTVQGYDAARVVIEGIRKGATSGETMREFLMTQRDLPTLAGPAGFGPDGTLRRPLFLLQVRQGKFVQLD
jgi:ABC-type branched-subunit amino acid transport system substrate-binding protein/predicted negative regulator of RcsB-dependent stress response